MDCFLAYDDIRTTAASNNATSLMLALGCFSTWICILSDNSYYNWSYQWQFSQQCPFKKLFYCMFTNISKTINTSSKWIQELQGLQWCSEYEWEKYCTILWIISHPTIAGGQDTAHLTAPPTNRQTLHWRLEYSLESVAFQKHDSCWDNTGTGCCCGWITAYGGRLVVVLGSEIWIRKT